MMFSRNQHSRKIRTNCGSLVLPTLSNLQQLFDPGMTKAPKPIFYYMLGPVWGRVAAMLIELGSLPVGNGVTHLSARPGSCHPILATTLGSQKYPERRKSFLLVLATCE